jgi:hypothetical protein
VLSAVENMLLLLIPHYRKLDFNLEDQARSSIRTVVNGGAGLPQQSPSLA